ncbi:hypothetical protein THF1C08_80243 [Vibrio jasicida]|nr:hypothetical protein THF1C08_80243 [Vibrio jasicida]
MVSDIISYSQLPHSYRVVQFDRFRHSNLQIAPIAFCFSYANVLGLTNACWRASYAVPVEYLARISALRASRLIFSYVNNCLETNPLNRDSSLSIKHEKLYTGDLANPTKLTPPATKHSREASCFNIFPFSEQFAD